MTGKAGGETGVDNDFVARGLVNIGAWTLGRNTTANAMHFILTKRPG